MAEETKSALKEILELRKVFRDEQAQRQKQLDEDRKALKAQTEAWANAENSGDKEVAAALDETIKTLQENIEATKLQMNVADALISEQENVALDDASGFEKVIAKYLGTPGDYASYQEKLIGSLRAIPDAVKGFGAAAVEKGKGILGAFFEALKAGVMLVGGLVALQGFIEGIGKVNKFFEGEDGIGMVESFAAGIAGIVQAFTGMSDKDAGELAQKVATGMNAVVDGMMAIIGAFARLSGLQERTNEADQGFMAIAKDFGIAIGAILFLFSGTLFPIIGFLATTAIPAIVSGLVLQRGFSLDEII